LKVLLLDTNRWALSSRLAISLDEAGFEAFAVCPYPHHPLRRTRAVKKTFPYDGFRPLESLSSAIESVKPDIVIPACDRSVAHLHELYSQSKAQGSSFGPAAVIEASLGNPESYDIVSSRHKLLAAAADAGVRVPRMCRVEDVEEFTAWKGKESYPWVLKADGTWGGGGVRIIQAQDQIVPALLHLGRMFRLKRALKRLIVNRDRFWLRSWWNRTRPSLIAQAYVPGRPANCSVVSWQGKILAGIAVEVVATDETIGPASIVRIVDGAAMIDAAQRIASKLGLSGFFGLDFMIEEKTGIPYLIEMNPRVTPPCHLRLNPGHDLSGALWTELTRQAPAPHAASISNDAIAYFPQSNGLGARTLATCYVDMPANEPELVQELLEPYPDRTLLFRIAHRLSRKPAAAIADSATPASPQPSPGEPENTGVPQSALREESSTRPLAKKEAASL